MVSTDGWIESADSAVREAREQPLSFEAYLNTVLKDPSAGAHAAKYLLDAIESMGTRTVIERGEELQRWRFFDDPHNDGEHAILGNTKTLNSFVEDVRAIASGLGKESKIVWVSGPTGTGKSEFKRCLVSGLREYSKTDEGRRYTVEWNVTDTDDGRSGMSYGDNGSSDEDGWYQSPVQSNPLSVLPTEVREDVIDDVNEANDDPVPIDVEADLDPFCREAYEYLADTYHANGIEDVFSEVTDRSHLRVTNYVVDIGQGIGVLHSEDDGSVKERLVGSWMPGMFEELESRGRKDPQAFSYDGVLSQGNGLLTVLEDASQHTKLLTKLLNVPDEGHVKLDKAIGMDIDTVMLVISNPDLTAVLHEGDGQGQTDKLRALRRRLEKSEIEYLTNVTLEAQLLRREVTDDTQVWAMETHDAMVEKMEEGVEVDVSVTDDVAETRELAPHAIEAAAMYDVISRLIQHDVLDFQEKAKLFDKGYIEDRVDEVYDLDDFELMGHDGKSGIPVTYTRNVISDLLQDDSDRAHEALDVESVIMPDDITQAMADGFDDEPMFAEDEAIEYDSRLQYVDAYIHEKQEEDVLDAILTNEKIDDATIQEYIEHVYAWVTDDTIEGEYGPEDPDPFVMKVFEVEHLGRFNEDDYTESTIATEVGDFREEEIVAPINRRTWERRNEDFGLDDIEFWDIPAIRENLHEYDWDYVQSTFDNFEAEQWDDPPENTETAEIKQKAIEYMVDELGYTEASAELTSRAVFREVDL